MVNTILLSIVAPAGGSSAPTGFLKLLTDTTVWAGVYRRCPAFVFAVCVGSVPTLSKRLGMSNVLRSIKMSPFPLIPAKSVLLKGVLQSSCLKGCYGAVHRTQLWSSRNLWKEIIGFFVSCRNLLSFLNIHAQCEPVKCTRNNSYKLTSLKYFPSFHPLPSALFLCFCSFGDDKDPPHSFCGFPAPQAASEKYKWHLV